MPSISPTSRRKQQKAETRERLLAAARDLFISQGYEVTTVKQIADHAEVAVGSVFAHFESKAELLSAIGVEQTERAIAAMKAASAIPGAPQTRLIAMLSAAAAVNMETPELVSAMHAHSWRWSPETEEVYGHALSPGNELIIGVLREAQAAGIVRADADLTLACSMLHALHVRNYRLAMFEDGDLSRLRERLSSMVDVLFAGMGAQPVNV